MKVSKKLLSKLKKILSAEHKAQVRKYDSLKSVLKSLRTEKHRLKEKLTDTHDKEDREEIDSRLIVVSEQRKKGLKLLKELKKERD